MKDLELKKEMLKMLKGDMKEMMGEEKEDLFKDLMKDKEGMQKVTVMAEDEEGLEEGLDKAQEILKAKYGEMDMESPMEEAEEMMEDEMEDEMCPKCMNKKCKC